MFETTRNSISKAGRLLRAVFPQAPPPPDFQPLTNAGGPL